MGGDLADAPRGKAPTLLIHAAKDPKGANLDRIQVVKGWFKNGQVHEAVYDVALSGKRKVGELGVAPPVGNTVDITTGEYANEIGTTELAAVWTDPDFDPTARTFYYARVLQIPTPRHTLFDAIALGIPHPPTHPMTIQERAYTSPVWYTPSEDQLAAAQAEAVTIAALQASGMEPLGESALEQLLVGQTLAVRNRVTGEVLEARFGEDGMRTLTNASESQVQRSMMQALHGTAGGSVVPYEIRDGRLVTMFDTEEFEIVVYQVDGAYLAARSDEQGYLNYEVLAR